MQSSDFKVFLTDYICSLSERTRVEKGALKIGFDWLMYNLAFAKGWTPVRLPFVRQSGEKVAKAKTEAEFGVDASFLLPSKTELCIFVLKDEVLNNKNWTRYKFDSDLRMAATTDVKEQGYAFVKSVKIILAYNKDEDRNGIKLYEQCAYSLGTKIGDDVSLSFERWNLTKIVEEVQAHITPDLLPQHVSGLVRYVCSLVGDFRYGSAEWENLVIPKWHEFLGLVLESPIDERKLRLIPVSLMIVNHYRKDTPDSYAGWVDLMEWAMLALWACCEKLPKRKLRKLKAIIVRIWLNLYVAELEKYFLVVEATLTTQHGFSVGRKGLGLGVSPVNDAYLAYWHIGRLGILTLAPQDFEIQNKSEYEKYIQQMVNRSADWLVKCLHANPGVLRPLVDLNHIELFLIWLILWQVGRTKDIYGWLSELESRLLVRRAHKHISVPFIEANSRLDLVAEYAATGERPYNFCDSSSYLLLMILELCFSLHDTQRDELLKRYMNRIVKGVGDDGQSLLEKEIELQSWVPPEDWSERILKEVVCDGIAITTSNFERMSTKEKPLSDRIRDFVEESRRSHPWKMPAGDVPLAVYILACIKHGSPLPPEFWRGTVFAPMREKAKKKERMRKQIGGKRAAQ